MSTKRFGFIVALGLLACRAYAYGPPGHELVGAIADEKLAGKPVGKKIKQMLGGISLATAAKLPDIIKSWDKDGPDAPRSFHLSSSKALDAQLRAFWHANPPTTNHLSATPSHHWFHYTDVPVLDAEKYADGKTGRTSWDIVHMMTFCVRVLNGQEKEQNARKITKPVAVVLLAHFVGDIHQPLHVGAEYFNASGQPVNPDKGGAVIGDNGGNSLAFKHSATTPEGRVNHSENLHGFWDNQAVSLALKQMEADIRKEIPNHPAAVTHEEIVRRMAAKEPVNWKLNPPTDVNVWAQQWADEILLVARLAHERLQFARVHTETDRGELVAKGEAIEKQMADGKSYNDWAGGVVKYELHKAGWRLADLLEKVVQ